MKSQKRKLKRKIPFCKCGCGQRVSKPGNKYILGHNNKKEAYEKSESNNRPHRFQNGNNFGKGRPQGSRNNCSIATENLFINEEQQLTRKCIELALNGNIAALKIAIDRICPVRKSVPAKISGMPKVKNVDDIPKLTEFLLSSVAEGKLSILDSEILSRVVDKHSKFLELNQIVQRIEDIEEKLQ